LDPVDQLEDHAVKPGDLQPREVLPGATQRRRSSSRRILSVRLRGNLFAKPDFVEAGARDERTENPLGAGETCAFRWGRWVRIGHCGAPASILEGKNAQAIGRRLAQAERRNSRFSRIGERSRCARARVSTLPHYAPTGVKAQAFVRCLF
jgi:hypothetical protein